MKQVKPLKNVNTPAGGVIGCICPPSSERTCQNPNCPRQDHRTLGERLREPIISLSNVACGKYRRPKGVMGGGCQTCGCSQPEHVKGKSLG